MPGTCCWGTTVFLIVPLDTSRREELVKNVTPPAEPARAQDPSRAPRAMPTSFCPTLAPAARPASPGTISMTAVLVSHAASTVEAVIPRPAVPPAETQTRSCSSGNVSMRAAPHSTIWTSPPGYAESATGVATRAAGRCGQTACSAWTATSCRTGPARSSARRLSTGTWASARAVATTVSSAKAPMSVHAVKSPISCRKPSVFRNAGRGTLQIAQVASAQPVLGHA